GLRVPRSTLRRRPCDRQRMTRGRDGWLGLSRVTLAFTTPCRFVPAHCRSDARWARRLARACRGDRRARWLWGPVGLALGRSRYRTGPATPGRARLLRGPTSRARPDRQSRLLLPPCHGPRGGGGRRGPDAACTRPPPAGAGTTAPSARLTVPRR